MSFCIVNTEVLVIWVKSMSQDLCAGSRIVVHLLTLYRGVNAPGEISVNSFARQR